MVDRLSPAEAGWLLDIADASVLDGLRGTAPSLPPLDLLPEALSRPSGVFVTLLVAGELNGCIGSVDPVDPLGHAASRHAWSAAFADPRLPALRPADYEHLEIEVSVLSDLEPLEAPTRAALLGALRPGQDGVVISFGGRRGVFLPAVWEQLPRPDVFVDHLQAKAGLVPGSWSSDGRAWRFTVGRHSRRTTPTSADRRV